VYNGLETDWKHNYYEDCYQTFCNNELSYIEPMALRKLPLGIQDFPSLREEGYLYVDKTALVFTILSAH
jgi:hypothetical protein